MLRQEMFDKVAIHLLTQNKKSGIEGEDGSFKCLYRSPEGNMCAIGALIPDSLYDPDMEDKSISSILTNCDTKYFEEMRQIFYDSEFASDLQYVHDGYPESSWYRKLKDFSIKYNINFDTVSQAYDQLQKVRNNVQ